MTKKPKSSSRSRYVFRKHDSIGVADAIADREYLKTCFVDNGTLSILADCHKPQCIITGRTGAGKTALLQQLAGSAEHVIQLAPDALALSYVSDSAILRFITELGVNLDLFYRLLWRHVFVVELIRENYNIINKDTWSRYISRLMNLIQGNTPKTEALEYLLRYGESYWLDSDKRVKEVTETLEHDLTNGIETNVDIRLAEFVTSRAGISQSRQNKLSSEQKIEVRQIGQQIVDKVQMRKLSRVMSVLNEDILDNKQKTFYITIDHLDEGWVVGDIRYPLIRALIETAKDFNHKIQNVKIILALRTDLLDRIFRYSRDPGYQEEKYQSLYLPISWSKVDLIKLLDQRIARLVREQYTTAQVSLRDIMPNSIHGNNSVEYILDRTLMRPRDAIAFINDCISHAEGKASLTATVISDAEEKYSESRLRALADEWSGIYSDLIELCLLLRGYPRKFPASRFIDNTVDHLLSILVKSNIDSSGQIYRLAEEYFEADDPTGFANRVIRILYRVGLIGVKRPAREINWSFLGQELSREEIDSQDTISIHAAFWRVLGVSQSG